MQLYWFKDLVEVNINYPLRNISHIKTKIQTTRKQTFYNKKIKTAFLKKTLYK